MDIILWLLPVCITLFSVIRGARRTWKNGLFLALVDLGCAILCAFAAFFLTRLLVNPEKVDLFGIGKLLLSKIPKGYLQASPSLAAFLKALPTAILALMFFSFAFYTLLNLCRRLVDKLNTKYDWSNKLLNFKHSKWVAMATGGLTALVCVLTDLVVVTGVITFSGNMLYCADVALGTTALSPLADSVHKLQNNPIISMANGLGCYEAYCDLTAARRDGERFSVGQELNDISETFVAILPVFDALPSEDHVPSAEEIRALPEALGESQEAMELLSGLVLSNTEALGDSDAISIISELLGTTPEQFEAYLETVDPETAHEDLTTFCNIAALLADRDLLPQPGENFPKEALEDEELLSLARQELAKNPRLEDALLP
jgi:hypothetical protein